jgi:TonB family protein
MSKLLTFLFFFQCLNLGFSQQTTASGKIIPEPILMDYYDALGYFQDDYAIVCEHEITNLFCLIDKKGKRITDLYKHLEHPKKGLLKVQMWMEDEYSIIDLSGKTIVPFGEYGCTIYDDYIVVSDIKNKKYKLLNHQGNEILSYDKPITPISKNRLLAHQDSVYQVIDEKGKVVVQTVAKELKKLNADYFAFKKDGAWGILNNKFKEVVSPKYDRILGLPNSWIGVYLGGKNGVLDANLREAIPIGAYDEVAFSDRRGRNYIGDGLIPVKRKDLWGYVNIDNKLVIDFFFYEPSAFHNGYALPRLPTRGWLGYILIDKEGKIVQNLPYDLPNRTVLGGSLIATEIDSTRCYVDFEGNIILKCKPKTEKAASDWLPPPPMDLPLPPQNPNEPIEKAAYLGGQEELLRFIYDNKIYPERAKKEKISGNVYVIFTIKTDGTLEDLEVTKSLGYGCDEEALRLVKALPQKWKPAMRQGVAIETSFTLSIEF